MNKQADCKKIYETEAVEKPLWGTVREIGLLDNILSLIPKRNKSLSVIDIGCGDGFLVHNIKRYFGQTVCFDLSVNRLKNTLSKTGVKLLVNGDVLALPFGDKVFDVVVCSEVLEHIEDYTLVLNELARIARSAIIITVPYKQEPVLLKCPDCDRKFYLAGHINCFKGDELANILVQKGFVLSGIKRFYTIFSYNKLTLKLPRPVRIFFDRCLVLLSIFFSFLKPNYAAVYLQRRD